MQLTTTVTVDNENSVARVALAGALNTDTAPDFEKRLVAVVAGGHQLTVLDMKDLDYISSAAMRRPAALACLAALKITRRPAELM